MLRHLSRSMHGVLSPKSYSFCATDHLPVPNVSTAVSSRATCSCVHTVRGFFEDDSLPLVPELCAACLGVSKLLRFFDVDGVDGAVAAVGDAGILPFPLFFWQRGHSH